MNLFCVVVDKSGNYNNQNNNCNGKSLTQEMECVIADRNDWGEPERAPHRRVERSQFIYYYLGRA